MRSEDTEKYDVRSATMRDLDFITDICFKTGYMGETLEDRDMFNDKKLFGLLFCEYYPKYEVEHCFVVTDPDDTPVGYIIGTDNTTDQISSFKYHMIPRIILRALFISSWRYPESLKNLLGFRSLPDESSETKWIELKYPAHFHINILETEQDHGFGTKLLTTFENHMKLTNVSGIHLSTTSANKKAVSFYKKHGYKELHSCNNNLWDLDDVEHIVMGKLQ